MDNFLDEAAKEWIRWLDKALRRNIRNADDRNEMISETLIAWWRRPEARIGRSDSETKAWLFQVATRRYSDHLRQLKPQLFQEVSQEIAAPDFVDRFVEKELARLEAQAFMAQWPPREARILFLILGEKQTPAEVAKMLGIDARTVLRLYNKFKKRIERGR